MALDIGSLTQSYLNLSKDKRRECLAMAVFDCTIVARLGYSPPDHQHMLGVNEMLHILCRQLLSLVTAEEEAYPSDQLIMLATERYRDFVVSGFEPERLFARALARVSDPT